MKFTPNQIETLQRLAPYAGKRVLVLTTVYEANVADEAKKQAIGIGFNASVLRSLAAKELIELAPMWKGAWVTVSPTLGGNFEQFLKDMKRFGK